MGYLIKPPAVNPVLPHPVRHVNTRIVKPPRIDQHPDWLKVYIDWIDKKHPELRGIKHLLK